MVTFALDCPASPDSDKFSTPPSTPGIPSTLRSERQSRPNSLHLIPGSWAPAVQLEAVAEDGPKPNRLLTVQTPTAQQTQTAMSNNSTQAHPLSPAALNSPCFLHSLLDKGALLSGLRNHTAKPSLQTPSTIHPHPKLEPLMPSLSPTSTPDSSPYSDVDDEDDSASSLTRQLAETAVSVREISKQLGRARVRSNMQNVLIITKAKDNRLIKLTRELALYLMKKPRHGERGLVVYVDHQLQHSKRFDAAGIRRDHPELFIPSPRRRTGSSNSLSSMTSNSAKEDYPFKDEGQLRYWTSEMCTRHPQLFDFVVTLGGDGTVLFTSWLFQRIVPPVLSFALGSLGFLTNFDFADYQSVMDTAIESGIRVNLRMRFTCTVYRAVAPEDGKGRRAVKKAETGEILMRNVEKGGWEALEGGWCGTGEREGKGCSKDKEIMCFTTRPVETFEVLNDLVVDRGPSPYVSLLELFGDEHHMTTVQADGLTVSTPTGSTAYSLSAGGSLVHPEIPALLITPICPHTLSFRPMLLPDSMELRICVPFNSRSTAWASFDGRGRVELKQGDHIKVTASKYPFPTVCADKQSTDWFHAISRTLKWNERQRQKSFVVVEEGPADPKLKKRREKKHVPEPVEEETFQEDEEEDECSDDEVEEEKFDIDDSSPEALTADAAVEAVAREKVQEEMERARTRSRARSRSKPRRSQSRGIRYPPAKVDTFLRPRSTSRTPGTTRLASPNRFAAPYASRLPALERQSSDSSDEWPLSSNLETQGDRDHIRDPQLLSGVRSRIPKDRDVEAESMKTPTATGSPRKGPHSHFDHSSRRAFAVWGQDETDSNTSDTGSNTSDSETENR